MAKLENLIDTQLLGAYHDELMQNDVTPMKEDVGNIKEVLGMPDANGHEYVDLGLPSGTLWATMNVGATSEEDYGNYYMYGKGARQYNSSDSPYSGTENPLDISVDTAAQVWGGSWRMPTRAQMQELTANTTYQWVTNYKGSGINGGTFTATNGAVLFIPAAGYWSNGSQRSVGSYGDCWGSSPNGSGSAFCLSFYNGGKFVNSNYRKDGYSVRGVLGEKSSFDGKTDKVSGATEGNLAGLDANGNLTDSGKSTSDFCPKDGLKFDSETGIMEFGVEEAKIVPTLFVGKSSVLGGLGYPVINSSSEVVVFNGNNAGTFFLFSGGNCMKLTGGSSAPFSPYNKHVYSDITFDNNADIQNIVIDGTSYSFTKISNDSYIITPELSEL